MNDIKTEFGGSTPIRLGNYYRNATGAYTANLSAIPLVGATIKVSQFRNTGKFPQYNNLDFQVLFGSSTLPTTAYSVRTGTTYNLNNSGVSAYFDGGTRGWVGSFPSGMISSTYNLGTSFTKSFYMYATATNTGNLVCSGNNSSLGLHAAMFNYFNLTGNPSYAIGILHNGAFAFEAFSSQCLIPLNTWKHVVITYDNSTTTYNVYVDGSSPHTYTSSSLNWTGGGTTGINIGGYGGATHWTSGYIDHVRIWNVALTSSEANQLYQIDSRTSISTIY